MAYTLFGRSQRLEDIYICGAFEKEGIKCDEDALLETKRLEKVFDNNEEVKKLKRANHWKISYLNVSSLNAHWEDVSIDNEINDSDVIGLGETWLEENKTVDLLNFAGYFANFGRGKGQAAFSKMQLSCQPEIVASSQFSAIFLKTSHFSIIFLYLSQNYNKDSVYNLLENWIQNDVATVVMGDINENLYENSMFEKFMKIKGFAQLINEPTFIAGSLLDHLYVNKAMKEKNIFFEKNSCYYSDHDAITLYIEK